MEWSFRPSVWRDRSTGISTSGASLIAARRVEVPMSESVEVDVRRVLPFEAYSSLGEYIAAGGGEGLAAARAVAPETIIDELAASGLRGQGRGRIPDRREVADDQVVRVAVAAHVCRRQRSRG